MTARRRTIKTTEGYKLEGPDPTALDGEQGTPVEPPQSETSIYLRDIFDVLGRYVFLIVVASVLVSGLALGFSLMQTPTYEGSIKMLVGQKVDANKPDFFLNTYDLQLLTRTTVEMIETTPVAETTIQRLGLQGTSDEFLKHLSAEQVSNTQLVEISYRDPSPERAQQIATTVGEVFAERLGQSGMTINPLAAKVWEREPLPDEPVSPKPIRNAAVGLAAGLIYGVVMAFVLEALRKKRPAK